MNAYLSGKLAQLETLHTASKHIFEIVDELQASERSTPHNATPEERMNMRRMNETALKAAEVIAIEKLRVVKAIAEFTEEPR